MPYNYVRSKRGCIAGEKKNQSLNSVVSDTKRSEKEDKVAKTWPGNRGTSDLNR